jgi:mycobactin lysine-N-oxygenase
MRIVIVGAGPKAAAIAARLAAWRNVLRHHESGKLVLPEVEIIELYEPGAAWSGKYGFSDGALELCNAGEKDVGFPYPDDRDSAPEAKVSLEVARSYSWFAFLVATGAHEEWVHRGRRFPTHRRWARYIEWVLKKAEAVVTKGKVTAIERDPKAKARQWRVRHECGGAAAVSEADAVVLTGTGPAIKLPGTASPADGFVDAETFWDPSIADRIARMTEGEIVVIGSGGAAGTILAHLASLRLGSEVGVISLSPLGALFPRGDGFAERRLSSDPGMWRSLPEEIRRDILTRTDAGVVSSRIKHDVDRSEQIVFRHGRALAVDAPGPNEDEMKLHYTLGGIKQFIRAKVVVAAMGFNSWGLLHPFGTAAKALTEPSTEAAKKFRGAIEAEFDADLCLPASAGLGPRLHIPLLAALAQGPGFASLGSLGKTASAILDPYILRP